MLDIIKVYIQCILTICGVAGTTGSKR
jgi:hypothetical protein